MAKVESHMQQTKTRESLKNKYKLYIYCIHILCERPTDGRMYSKIVRAIKLALLFSLFLRESKKQIHRQRVYIGTTTK